MPTSPQIELFARRAIKRGIMDESQARIVKEMISVDADLDEFTNTILEFGVCTDSEAVETLKNDTFATWNAMSTEDRLLVTNEVMVGGDRATRGDTLGLDWFCFFAISEGILTKETCISIAAEIEDLTDVLIFAQAVVDRCVSGDFDKLQKCVEKAALMMKTGRTNLPYRIFGRGPAQPAAKP